MVLARGRWKAEVNVFLLVFALLASFSACASGSAVVTGEKRPPIAASQVKVYLDPPAKYETIGLVEASSDVEFTSQGAVDRAMHELKRQAARIGANGVLLLSTSSQSGTSGFYSGGVYYPGDSDTKGVSGRAIWVVDE